ncbi:alpha-glucosidase [Chondrus crispus]|uniref:Mannosyl-oligosaccharide glucosidase n=1 Tax=Chondrus crispus TaxID=2769 RepID=R7QNY8_CHOCR|nr:alpha-glucosidase [Chondrus crispus]CDF39814.1 alpha-glucosidase [Chondrus crispus]|eukprot:XP_005710108.1 alpha-glucosidase [Chondrus crispus]
MCQDVRNLILLVFLVCLFPVFCQATPSPRWGTFRPQALISARAAVPHSPLLGFMYHPASSLSIRHLATDNHDKISSFSWSRHDGRYFGDQHIVDKDLNINITTHFQHHPNQEDAWAIRVTAVPIDSSRPTEPISLVFYATAGPDDIDKEINTVNMEDAPLWGTVGLGSDMHVSREGIEGDVVLEGIAESVGGRYKVLVKEPEFGSVSDVASEVPTSLTVSRANSASGSRAFLRARGDIPEMKRLPVDTFHVASLPSDPKLAWAVEKVLDRLLQKSRAADHNDQSSSLYVIKDAVQRDGQGVLVQRLVEAPFQIDVAFARSDGRTAEEVDSILTKDLGHEGLQNLLEASRKRFDAKFDRVFELGAKNVSVDEQAFAKAALSNLLGGIGFFYGSSVAQEQRRNPTGQEVLQFLDAVGLLTATPSRALFPRGFLWDEGFHQLVVQRWDENLSRECMESWMGAIQATGWIPREQILGLEARSRFPEHVQHLMIQNPKVANPPTILMPLRVLASLYPTGGESRQQGSDASFSTSNKRQDHRKQENRFSDFSRDMLKQVVQYYSWLKRTQSGREPNSFRWRGRSAETKAPEGYPLTLASGLDDYPRAEVPSVDERHVDLHCWMTWASGALAKLSERAGNNATRFWEEHNHLRKSLIDLHGSQPNDNQSREDLLLCDYDGSEKVCHEGYVTILPLALGLLEPTDLRLGAILDALEDPGLLRARAGVRSLSRKDEWHRKGDDYWTGSVWMPFNFLTLAALRTKYSIEDGPYKERAAKILEDLQQSVLQNAFKVYSETGQLWENYSPDDDGSGKSGRQFTGWSSLILLMYADMYDGVT